jgi:hypothetical protein
MNYSEPKAFAPKVAVLLCQGQVVRPILDTEPKAATARIPGSTNPTIAQSAMLRPSISGFGLGSYGTALLPALLPS